LPAIELRRARLGGAPGLAFNAATQGIHQVDDIGVPMRGLRLQWHALLLGANEVDQRVLVAILELIRLKPARHLVDDVLGQFQHLRGQLQLGDLGEITIGRVHLIGEMQAGRHDALTAGFEPKHALAAEENSAREPYHLFRSHRLADHSEGLFADAIGGRQIIGGIEIKRVDIGARHEALDIDGVIALDRNGFELVVLEHEILALGNFVALGLIFRRNGLARLFIDVLAPNTVTGVAIEGAEGNALRGGRGRIEGDGAGHERKLQISLPIGPGGHGERSDTLGTRQLARLWQGRVNVLLTLSASPTAAHAKGGASRRAERRRAPSPRTMGQEQRAGLPDAIERAADGRATKEMTRGLGGPRVKARLAREGSRRGVLRAGRKKNVPGRGRFRPDPEKILRAAETTSLTSRRSGWPPMMAPQLLDLRVRQRASPPIRSTFPGPGGAMPWRTSEGETRVA